MPGLAGIPQFTSTSRGEVSMRRIPVLSAVLLIACVGSAQIKFGAGPQLGVSFASAPKPLDKVYGFGFGFGAHGDVMFNKYFTARLSFDYHMFSADESELSNFIRNNFTDQNGQPLQNVAVTGGGASIIGIMASGIGKLPLGGSVTPYATVGIGYGSLSTSDLKVTFGGGGGTIPVDTESGFSLAFGAGSEFAISKVVSLYGEVKYVLIFTSEETDPQTGQKSGGSSSHLPITFGATFWF